MFMIGKKKKKKVTARSGRVVTGDLPCWMAVFSLITPHIIPINGPGVLPATFWRLTWPRCYYPFSPSLGVEEE